MFLPTWTHKQYPATSIHFIDISIAAFALVPFKTETLELFPLNSYSQCLKNFYRAFETLTHFNP